MNENFDHSLRMFIRGLSQDNLTEIYEGHKALFRIGRPAIPKIREAIFKSNWVKIKYAGEMRYVSGLVNLIHDIDESEGRKITDQLKSNGCDLAIEKVLDSICSFTLDDYHQYIVCGVNIFEHIKIFTRHKIKTKLEHWLKTIPIDDLKEIERIYVIRKEDLQSRGNYGPILYQINLVWDNPYSRGNPLSWMANLLIESTLYHEIGHHVHRHTFGQDPDQEKEANNYSDRIMANSSHKLAKVGRVIRKVVKSLHRNKQDSGDA